MGFSHIQGGNAVVDFFGTSCAVALSGVQAGDCLIASFGFVRDGNFAFNGLPAISDSKGNKWVVASMSPCQVNAVSANSIQIITYIATNCASGNTTVTVSGLSQWSAILFVDEYSGPASIRAVDQVALASTAWGSGLSSIGSGSLALASGEMLYSVALIDKASGIFTASAGFSQREYLSGTLPYSQVSMASYDQTGPSPGSYSNTVSSSVVPDSIHVVLLSLSAAPISSPVVQTAIGTESAAFATTVSAAFSYPNTAGNLLILACRVQERGNCTVTDTQGNTWVVVYGSGITPGFAFAYCLNCAGGPNTVTLNGTTGGSDVTLQMLLAEYHAPGAAYVSSNEGANLSGSSVNTGNIIAPGAELLISCFIDYTNSNDGPLSSSPGIRRFQMSDAGYISAQPGVVVLADQRVNSAGTYSNTFDSSPNSGSLQAAILGFSVPAPASPQFPHVFAMT